jgi:hypothetical protein
MKKSMLKRLTAVIMAVVMILPNLSVVSASNVTAHVYAQSDEYNIIHNVTNEFGETILEINERVSDGRIFYFNKTDEYVTTMDICLREGIVNIHRNDIEAGILTFDSVPLEDFGFTLNARSVNAFSIFEETMELLDEGEISLDNSYQLIEHNEYSSLIQPLVHPILTHQYTAPAMAARGHREHSNRLMSSLTERNRTARLYERVEFRVGNQMSSIRLGAHFTINMIAAAIGKTNIIAGAMFRAVGNGVLGSTFDVTVWRINPNYFRTAFVNGWNLASADRWFVYEIQFGRDAADARRVQGPWYWTSQSTFHDTRGLKQTAITEALRNGI